MVEAALIRYNRFIVKLRPYKSIIPALKGQFGWKESDMLRANIGIEGAVLFYS